MLQSNRWMVVVLIIAGLLVSACGPTTADESESEPARVEPIEGTDLNRVILTAKAAERLDIQTVPVREAKVVRKGTAGEALAKARAKALDLEKRAYTVSKDVYGRTPPAEHILGAEAITGSETASKMTTDSETEKEFEDFDPNNFDRSTNIDNEWLPLRPGTQLIYEGFTNEDGEPIPHRVVSTVTDLTKLIDGVRAVVVWDQDYSDGELVEEELAFFAQDNDGNVWRLGEYPEEYEDGEFIDAPAWITGLDGTRAGIAMKAEPRLGTPSYSQGWAPSVDFTDRAQVYQMGQQTCVPVDCYEDVLVMDEFNPGEPDAFQEKYYARGVGNVRVDWRGDNEETKETLELVAVVQLGPAEAVLRQVIPYAAVLYDLNGDTFTYTSPEPLVFVRHPISIDYIEGDLAVLSDGPPSGTAVVTVGAAELYGTESGIGR